MKKIKLYIGILVSLVLFGACDQLNDYPVFDDADAFVAITAENFAVLEDAGTLKVPVRLTSLAAKSVTVTFELIDGTAKSGKDFQLKGGASVLTYDGSEPVKDIEIDILPQTGIFTGDLSFSVVLKTVSGVNMGSVDTATVTINDIDHPLSKILGAYTVFGPNYFSGREDTWDVNIEKDPEGDLSKVWLTNLVVAGTSLKVYGIVNDDMSKIEIPVGQQLATSASYTSIVLAGFDDPDINQAGLLPEGSKITMNLTQDSPVKYVMDLPFGSHIEDVDSWYSIVLAGATFTKK